MKKLLFFSALAAMTLVACQSYDTELPMPDDEAALTAVQKEKITQITEDVNSGEVKNILGSLFGKQRKGRSAEYTVSLLKDKQGVDRVICINYADNGGFALISAEKTHSPILAYAEEGNFTVTDSLPFPLSEWMDCTMHSIADSESLPADSLEKIAGMWHRYEVVEPLTMSRLAKSRSISPEESVRLFHIMKPYLDEWASHDEYRVYSIDQYTSGLSFGSLSELIGYVQGNIFPTYIDDYSNITVVVERDNGTHTTFGSRFNTHWEQRNGFNQSFKLRPGYTDEHIPVGCGPIALGQLMYGYKYPTYFNWSAMSTSAPGNKVTSDFLLDVFNKSNAEYHADKNLSSTTIDDLASALKKYGYSYKKISGSSITANTIKLGCPAIMGSTLGGEISGGHAWLIEGGGSSHLWTTAEVWTFTYPDEFKCIYSEDYNHFYSTGFYVNWGWGSKYNGYYGFDNMIPDDYNSNSIKDALINITHP